jgi:hypothetical protein
MGLSAQLETRERLALVSPEVPVGRIPVWLYPQVLSFDAPLVAVCWQWLFAKSFRAPISPLVLFVTAACVWMIYVGDHLLDVCDGVVCSARHHFVRSHARPITFSLMAMLFIAGLGALRLPFTIVRSGVALAAVVALYLFVVHVGGDTARRYWPKELVIGAVFAAGSSIATWNSGASVRLAWPEMALFAALCTLNCAAIDCWEWKSSSAVLRYPHRLTRWLARNFYAVAVVIAVASGVAQLFLPNAVGLAIIVSAFLLMSVGGGREFVSPEAARLLADAALLTPLIFLVR